MRRVAIPPRANWRARNEELGFLFHSMGGTYWDERAAYAFTAEQIDELEEATNELHRLSLIAVEHVVRENRFGELGMTPLAAELARRSWDHRAPPIYGRMDLAYDGVNAPKLLEYNADTPTALLEASVAQWAWLEDVLPDADQFNSIHERLLDAFSKWPIGPFHFACARDSQEDLGTVEYLRDVATQAGHTTKFLFVEDIGWNGADFVDLEGYRIDRLFKLYPWEWLVHEEFGGFIEPSGAQFAEPAWKAVLSNKGILKILWELFPGHPNLLPASFSPLPGEFVRKPLLSREGANVTLPGEASGGDYGAEGFVYQGYAPLPEFLDATGRPVYPVIGAWVIEGEAGGIGIREDDSRITKNTSRFVPHYFE
ncbi:glutathionylspermidine synthase family protein [Deinococcus yavapaiensis]|uniref:Glutathionylspermidine synthase n=1 Tax=Deinococcus yavapaiensis KR-236 TaxID=694435 RepID=A0A318SF67_9DEIO|nr:glutathionylspermidine synthase family protein [Deinococcus yavapaiensis]PYE56437.1 glutathionylspermidine synthase [Deinococcus yavapaiensis KR-236]